MSSLKRLNCALYYIGENKLQTFVIKRKYSEFVITDSFNLGFAIF